MKKEAVIALVSELEALRGLLRGLEARLWALEKTVLANPASATLYSRKLLEREQDPNSMFPLVGLAELQKILLQDQS